MTLNFIIYDDDNCYIKQDVIVINEVLLKYDINYHIYKFNKYDIKFKNIVNNHAIKKIYILSVNMKDVSGIDIAEYIRKNDSNSVIILVTNKRRYKSFDNHLLIFDMISKLDNYQSKLLDDINLSVNIIFEREFLIFKYKSIIYKIPYIQINYIEKESTVKRCIIHTLDNEFYVVSSIEHLLETLGMCFFRTHQSCIVNTNNVKEIDLSTNTIFFINGDMTNLLANKVKRDVKKYFDIL